MNMAIMDYLKIAVFTAAFFMLFKFGLRQFPPTDHFADTF